MDLLTRDDLALDGFAGLRERLYVMDSGHFGDRKLPESRDGLGQLVYLADAIFVPHGSTRAHDHSRIDIVSVVVRGRLRHEGSLGHGELLQAGDVQVQYAGEHGFRHNEINPDAQGTHMIQLWLAPREHRGAARYRTCRPAPAQRCRVYGGQPGDTAIDIWPADAGGQTQCSGPVLGYLVSGGLEVIEQDQPTRLAAETLFRGEDLTLTATAASLVILATLCPAA